MVLTPACEKSFLERKEYNTICRSPRQIETYSFGQLGWALNAISDRNKTETLFPCDF